MYKIIFTNATDIKNIWSWVDDNNFETEKEARELAWKMIEVWNKQGETIDYDIFFFKFQIETNQPF